jgi:hypothetical protein
MGKTRTTTTTGEQVGVTDPLRRLIAQAGGKSIKLHGGPMFSGHPDIFACMVGYCVVVETKREGAAGPTARQQENLRRWTNAGAIALWTDNADEAILQILREIVSRDQADDADAIQRFIEREGIKT